MTALERYLKSIQEKTVAVIGAGVSNMPLIGLLRKARIAVTVHDKKTVEELGEQFERLDALGVSFDLGAGYLDSLREDVIFRTPGLHPNHPALCRARADGAQVTSEMELFFAVCPCPIIGITGSDGKTTTTTLVYEMLRHAGFTVYLGGNIGKPLLPEVDQMQPSDVAVVELSSFQLMNMKYSPSVAAITNLSPNHLDYHKDFAEYVEAKTAIYSHQKTGDRLVLNLDDAETAKLNLGGNHEIWYTSKKKAPDRGVYLREDGMICVCTPVGIRELLPEQAIHIPGAHNVYNLMMAAAVVQGRASDEDIRAVARGFGGVEHRIEFVREKDGVRYYNDSIASSPTRTIAGLCAFDQKLILIAGGYDKHIPYDVLGEPISQHVKTLILTGATAPKIRNCIEPFAEKPEIFEAANLAQAVTLSHKLAQPGDIVIMSPASASFDAFKNFMERGELFKKLVQQL